MDDLDQIMPWVSYLNSGRIGRESAARNASLPASKPFMTAELRSAIEQIETEACYYSRISDALIGCADAAVSDIDPEDFYPRVLGILEPAGSTIDLGCGVRPVNLPGGSITVCVELFQPYLDHLKNRRPGATSVLVQADALPFMQQQADRSIETIWATDVIEHMSRAEGTLLIREILRVSSRQAVIITPNGFMQQHVGHLDDDEWGFRGNRMQTHVSGWSPDDFPGWIHVRSKDYYLESGYKDGVFAAIWKQPTETPEHAGVVIIIDALSDHQQSDSNTVSAVQRFIDQATNLPGVKECDVLLLMPFSCSPFSSRILTGLRLPSGRVSFVSFNPAVNALCVENGKSRSWTMPGVTTSRTISANPNLVMTLNLRHEIRDLLNDALGFLPNKPVITHHDLAARQYP